jgi:zinc protease
MISYKRFSLENGLRLLVHEDRSTPLVAINILYNVGAKDEDQDMTGFAHLFEHLMFGGSVNIPEYDTPLQVAGGENNAFTNNDITNYYITIPADNIETGLWLESDRMLGLDFSLKNLETQKKVVVEEYNQRYLNQPYGDAILNLRPLAYKIHPYRWPTIGMDITHIEKAELTQVKEFFFSHYAPNNAILSIAGNISGNEAFRLVNKWFGGIERRVIRERNIPAEPIQSENRKLTLEKDLPADAIYKAWHTVPRLDNTFRTLDLITDLLAGGESGRLNTKLVRELRLFSDINAYITSDIDPGLLIIHGKLMKNVRFSDAEEALAEIIGNLARVDVPHDEMEKVKNKFEASSVFSNTSILNKAYNLCFYELLDNADLINHEVEEYQAVNTDMVRKAAKKYLSDTICNSLYFKSTRNN